MANAIRELTAERIVQLLLDGPESSRLEIYRRLHEPSVNHDRLRALILEQLQPGGAYAAGREQEDRRDIGIYWVRSWLCSVLAQLPGNSPETQQVVEQHLDHRQEPQPWVRHWTLEGLIVVKHPRLPDIARRLANEDPDELIKKLAQAALATLGDKSAHDAVAAGLRSTEIEVQWATLRALRVLWLPSAIITDEVLLILERRWQFDLHQDQSIAYDAIIAAAQIPEHQTRYREDAATLIATRLWDNRHKPIFDAIRQKALQTLGKLKVESTAPRLLECLNDSNPAIVRDSIRALTGVLTLPTAVARVVEMAARQERNQLEELARALAWLNRDEVAEELENLLGVGTSAQQDIALELLRDIGGSAAHQKLSARRDIINKSERYVDLIRQADSQTNQLFNSAISGATLGFNISIVMSVTLFVIGLVLIALTLYLLLARADLLATLGGSALTAGAGVIGILQTVIGAFLVRSRSQLDSAVNRMAYQQTVFRGYLQQLQHANQGFMRRLLEDSVVATDEIGAYLQMTNDVMNNALLQIRQATAAPSNVPASPGHGDAAQNAPPPNR